MDELRRHWEKGALLLSLLIFGYFGYGVYTNLQISPDGREVDSLRQQVDTLLERNPEENLNVPDYVARASAPWNLELKPGEGRNWLFHVPLLNQPTLDVVATTTVVMPGPTNLTATASVKEGVTLKWGYEKIEQSEHRELAAPEAVTVQRREEKKEEWTTITTLNSSGTGTQTYVDAEARPRTAYLYRVRVETKPDKFVGDDPSRVFEGPPRKETQAVEVQTPSGLRLIFTGTAGDGATITIRKFDREQGTWREKDGIWEPEERIGDGFFETPFTFKRWTEGTFQYWVQFRDTDVTDEGQEIVTYTLDVRKDDSRQKMIYVDEEGNTYSKWRKRGEYPNQETRARPWDQVTFDKYISRVPKGPKGNPVPTDREAIVYKPKPGAEENNEENGNEEGETSDGTSEEGADTDEQ